MYVILHARRGARQTGLDLFRRDAAVSLCVCILLRKWECGKKVCVCVCMSLFVCLCISYLIYTHSLSYTHMHSSTHLTTTTARASTPTPNPWPWPSLPAVRPRTGWRRPLRYVRMHVSLPLPFCSVCAVSLCVLVRVCVAIAACGAAKNRLEKAIEV